MANDATLSGSTTDQVPEPYGEHPAPPQADQGQTTNAEINPSQSTNTGVINTGTSVAVSNRPSPAEKEKGKDKKGKKDDKPPQPLPQGSLDPIGQNLFDPAMFLEPHDEVPIAMVCRKPYGSEVIVPSVNESLLMRP